MKTILAVGILGVLLCGCWDGDINLFGDQKIDRTITVSKTDDQSKTDARTYYEITDPLYQDVTGDGIVDTKLTADQIDILKQRGWTFNGL
jgi:hypothetical protein